MSKQKEKLTNVDFFRILKILKKYDCRSIAIVGGAYLENSLTELIKRCLCDCESTSKLINGTFYNKIELANALGIISNREYEDLKVIKEVRNRFAHSMLIEDFDDDIVKCRCKKLTLYNSKKNDTLQNLYSKTVIGLACGFSIRKNFNYSRIETDGYDELKKISTKLFSEITSANIAED